MGCGCNKGNNRKQFEVVAADGRKVLWGPTASKATAEAVSKRYPGSKVQPQGAATTAPSVAAPVKAPAKTSASPAPESVTAGEEA